jgi:hypothetical protein
MSRCIGLPARAGGLIALLRIFRVFFRLLLICDVESALSLLMAVVKLCYLWAGRGVRAGLVVSYRVISTAELRGAGLR